MIWELDWIKVQKWKDWRRSERDRLKETIAVLFAVALLAVPVISDYYSKCPNGMPTYHCEKERQVNVK